MNIRLLPCLAVLAALALCGCANHTKVATEALTLAPESLQMRQLQTRRFDTSDEPAMLSASAAVLQDLGFTIDESNHELGVLVCSKQRDATNAGQVTAAIIIAALGGGAMPVDSAQTIRVSLVTRPVARAAENAAQPARPQPLTKAGIDSACAKLQAKLDRSYYEELSPLFDPKTAKNLSAELTTGNLAELRKDLTLRMNSVDFGATSVRVTFQRVVVNTHGQATRLEALTDPVMYQEFFEKLSKSVFLEAQEI
ncbi:hypothetical protein [Desulfovibrio sp.]